MKLITGRKIYNMFNTADDIRKHFSDDTQIIFSENFLVYPAELTYLNMTKQDMANYGMIDELAERVVEDALRQWKDNQQDKYGDFAQQSKEDMSYYIQGIIENWK